MADATHFFAVGNEEQTELKSTSTLLTNSIRLRYDKETMSNYDDLENGGGYSYHINAPVASSSSSSYGNNRHRSRYSAEYDDDSAHVIPASDSRTHSTKGSPFRSNKSNRFKNYLENAATSDIKRDAGQKNVNSHHEIIECRQSQSSHSMANSSGGSLASSSVSENANYNKLLTCATSGSYLTMFRSAKAIEKRYSINDSDDEEDDGDANRNEWNQQSGINPKGKNETQLLPPVPHGAIINEAVTLSHLGRPKFDNLAILPFYNTNSTNNTSGFAVASALVTCSLNTIDNVVGTPDYMRYNDSRTSKGSDLKAKSSHSGKLTSSGQSLPQYLPNSVSRSDELYSIPQSFLPGRNQSSTLSLQGHSRYSIDKQESSSEDEDVSCSGYYTSIDLENLATARLDQEKKRKKSASHYSTVAYKHVGTKHVHAIDSSFEDDDNISTQASVQASRATPTSDMDWEFDVSTTSGFFGTVKASSSKSIQEGSCTDTLRYGDKTYQVAFDDGTKKQREWRINGGVEPNSNRWISLKNNSSVISPKSNTDWSWISSTVQSSAAESLHTNAEDIKSHNYHTSVLPLASRITADKGMRIDDQNRNRSSSSERMYETDLVAMSIDPILPKYEDPTIEVIFSETSPESIEFLTEPSTSAALRTRGFGSDMENNESRSLSERQSIKDIKQCGSSESSGGNEDFDEESSSLKYEQNDWRKFDCFPKAFWKRQQKKSRPSVSPRSKNLADLNFLTAQHQYKVQQMSQLVGEDPDEQFDFVVILQRQQMYEYWANLLDFRAELLGNEFVEAMDEQWNGKLANVEKSESLENDVVDDIADLSSDSSDSYEIVEFSSTKCDKICQSLSTPVGMRRRRAHTADNVKQLHSSGRNLNTPAISNKPILSSIKGRGSYASPSIYSIAASASVVRATDVSKNKQQSLFERAVGTPDIISARHGCQQSANFVKSTPTIKYSVPFSTSASVGSAQRRGWGYQTGLKEGARSGGGMDLTTQYVGKITSIMSGTQPHTRKSDHQAAISEEAKERATNELYIEDIPNHTVARGIAARLHRNNGLTSFLHAMRRGVILRRHRPGTHATFCRLFSYDDGDTINFSPVDYEEAMNAFKEQRIRYNNTNNQKRGIFADPNAKTDLAEPQEWSYEKTSVLPENSANVDKQKEFSVPDYVAADAYRKKQIREKQIASKVSELATKVVNTGTVKCADIIAVHPSRNRDPRSALGELGSTSLRKSKTEYSTSLSFSLVIRNGTNRVGIGMKECIEDLENKWHEKEGNETLFKYLDFEAATEGEYWFVFRGLLLLHRDATVGRFARERAAGISGGNDHTKDAFNLIHKDEFMEPKTVGCFQKLYVKLRDLDTTYMVGAVQDGARPPPSDYFLGFRSPGTAIWSRLRQAGLETRRIYSLDPRRVMIKVRCPPDRLLDVAEVLRIRLKTKEGSYTAFEEELIDAFDAAYDPTEGVSKITSDFQFRSCIRQLIIEFIVCSRIRDSGAELGPSTDIGRLVEARVPLHFHRKLDAIYNAWFYFWKVDNWKGRDGRSLSHEKVSKDGSVKNVTYGSDDGSDSLNSTYQYGPPCFLKRLLIGCMYQPLDSIEQYFGEKVAFYFTWLQHTTTHLVFLSAAGTIVFICQCVSQDVNHTIRPFFSIVVMLWTFIVLNNWKKRASFMAYRWGTLDYKEQETTRPQFHGDFTRDDVTGDWIVVYPRWKRWLKYCISFPLTLLFTFGTLILILWVHANRDLQLEEYIAHKKANGSSDFQFDFKLSSIGNHTTIDINLSREHLLDANFWVLVVGLPSMLGLFLPLLNFILMRLSILLNEFENYRTESEYRTHLIIKVFSFRFVCYFAALYYYAFMSVGNEDAINNGILRVGSGVLVYTTVAQYWQYFLHVCFPILVRKIRMRNRRKRLLKELREIELEEEALEGMSGTCSLHELKSGQIKVINKRLLLHQAQDDTWLEVMNPLHDSFPEYIQAVVQFTFVSCFSVVMPLTPCIVLVNHLISMRLDAFKLCKGRRRPLAEKTGGIGVWEHLLHIVAVISVLTNCWLMGFTSAQSLWIKEKIGQIGVFAIIVLWEHSMLLIRYILSASTSTLPKAVRDSMKKEQHNIQQQRNSMMRERRHQRDRDLDVVEGETLTELNRRILYNHPILQASTSEEECCGGE